MQLLEAEQAGDRGRLVRLALELAAAIDVRETLQEIGPEAGHERPQPFFAKKLEDLGQCGLVDRSHGSFL